MKHFASLSRSTPAVVLSAIGAAAVAGAVSASCSPSTGDVATPKSEIVPVEAGAGGPEASTTDTYPVVALAEEAQRSGDPKKGYRALINEPYVPCGIPSSVFPFRGAPAPRDFIEGREGSNANLPYKYTAMTTKDGVDIVTSNCLTCHAGYVQDKLFVGLGDADGDYTQTAEEFRAQLSFADSVVKDPKERAEFVKWRERVETVAPYSTLSTRGPNPADEFTAVLFAHHDPKTMAWSSEPLIDVAPPTELPVDVPPWWRMKKKTSMFYVGAGRGDHARTMMTASILCTSSVEESRAIDAYFPDIRAYILSIEPPAYPFEIDRALAARGRPVFEATCARCHGTYGESTTYPNRLIGLEEIGTDALLASGTAQFGVSYTDWYAQSFFGEIARMEPKEGYVAPPLDGIWATAPYLHNGSVPTIAALLDSTARPTYWTRSFDSKDFDPAALGWRFTSIDHGKDAEPNASKKAALYDTTRLGYGNGGHTFGDRLSPEERAAVLEYLKTL